MKPPILQQLQSLDITIVLYQLLPAGKRTGHEYLASNPLYPADRRYCAFVIDFYTGNWNDTDGCGNGDIIALYAYLMGITDRRQAATRLVAYHTPSIRRRHE